MARAQTPVAARTRQGIKLSNGNNKSRVDLKAIVWRTLSIVILASLVNYVTSWRYKQKKAAYEAHAGTHANTADAVHDWTRGLPKNCVLVDWKSLGVRNAQDPWKNATEIFTPGHTFSHAEPVFQIFDRGFLDILGDAPSIQLIAENNAYMFAHEAPIWYPPTDEVFMCSNAGHPPSSLERTNVLSKLSLQEAAAKGTATVTEIQPIPTLEMTNGGTLFMDKLLFVNSGRGSTFPPTLALVEPLPPYNSTVILDNYFGMQFNSLNDAKVHPVSKAIFFTDPTYGDVGNFRPPPQLPRQVYRFDAETGEIRVVADGFSMPNGPAFSPDGRTAYLADSGSAWKGGYDSTRPQTIYAFDVDSDLRAQTWLNRRVFAYVDTGIPDGLVLDTKGNLYAATGDGVHVFSPRGILLGKIFIGSTSANIAFAGKGRLVVLAETKVFLVKFAAEGMSLDFWGMSRAS
ncbi:calcium-dependent phosphotriesterase [Exidia glandulosa HHB12029]|uniref:Calcium-dependent phosphotriesterase n=1 Tax=Exidia glandulosa HHB12029 TaxID=1314781 RepID=A0A165K606_EXIGL|nr:calcium-dependent phosphotriesterase [Exidia glandulosa HHB12029]